MKNAAPRSLLLLLALSTLSGCLKARETDRVFYEPTRDEFHLAMVLENISADGKSDMEYLNTLRLNKDHLIAPCMPGNAFGFAPWFLRLDDHKTAKVTFSKPTAGDMQPIDATASLKAIDIRPGEFFIQDNTLCYYHAMTIPGKTIDGLIEQTRKDQLGPLKKAVQAEVDRRKKKGAVHTWPELIKQEVDAVKSGSTDHPIKPFNVLEEASLDQLVKVTADLKLGFTRKGKDFVIALPLTPKDRDGMCELWKEWVKAADAAATDKKSDPMLALQRLPAQSITISPAPDGVVVDLDIIKMYMAFGEASAALIDSKSPPPKPPAHFSYEAKYAQDHQWPLGENHTTAQIFKDFAAGTLKSVPSETPVPPGTDLKVQPKKK